MSDYYFLSECKKLKKLITQNPDLPLIFFADEAANNGAYRYMSCDAIEAYKGKILDCPNTVDNETIFYYQRWFEEDLRGMLCGKDEYLKMSDEEFYEIFKKEKSKYDDKWKDCIIVYVGN